MIRSLSFNPGSIWPRLSDPTSLPTLSLSDIFVCGRHVETGRDLEPLPLPKVTSPCTGKRHLGERFPTLEAITPITAHNLRPAPVIGESPGPMRGGHLCDEYIPALK